ncbi:MAG: putative tannase/feruloyl esterase [Proteobacteria bacterium]|nr:putative tannase/feruloyl esterase [Pseudomonadota bacterium]
MKYEKRWFAAIMIVFLLSGCARGVGVKKAGVSPDGVPTQAVPSKAVAVCTDLGKAFRYPNAELTSVSLVPEGTLSLPGINDPMPEHCLVKGKMNERVSKVDGKRYAIGFEMRLPTSWNGRFFYQANAGLDGRVVNAYGDILGGGPTSNGLLKGFAVISSDAGHQMEEGPIGDGVFGIDPQARIDYGYNAVAQLTPMAKNLIRTYYGRLPDKSYIVGTSNGGRHAMVAASRCADQYDGFLAGSPGFNLPKAAVAQLWGVQQYRSVSETSAKTNRPDVSTSFSAADLQLVSGSILGKCDVLDGLADNIVSDIEKCQSAFNIENDVPTCSGPPDGKCLTKSQKEVLAKVHAGAKNSAGQSLYASFPWDVGISSSAWRTWKFANSTGPRDPLAVGFVFMTPPVQPTGHGNSIVDFVLNFNVDTDAPKIYATDSTYTESSMSFMTPPEPALPRLVANHGKLIVVHGSADPVFSVNDTINWYEGFRARYRDAATDTVRLFVVPGMSHSRGGPATDQFDMVDALVNWVERGIAPNVIAAKARGKGAVAPAAVNTEVPPSWSPGRTRPLCAYPEVPRYKGSGDIETASSFSCVTP